MFSFFLSPTFPCLPYILKKLRGMSFGSRSFMQVVSDITLLSDFGPGFIPLSYQADTIFFLLAHTQHNLFFKQFPCADVVLLNNNIEFVLACVLLGNNLFDVFQNHNISYQLSLHDLIQGHFGVLTSSFAEKLQLQMK
ncbi:hypothetical protein HKD37_10G027211 [Glycine soja]